MTPGRRREDTPHGSLPEPWPEPGDYWKVLASDGSRPLSVEEPGNLTGGVWMICAPNSAIGTLVKHAVREHEDGTISVRSGDGSSNSILIGGGNTKSWHGYIEQGVWREVA